MTPKVTGRPSYHPSVSPKLYIHEYLNRVQSSRRLEREAGRNVEVMWLMGRLVPDHKTIVDFRKDRHNELYAVLAAARIALGKPEEAAEAVALLKRINPKYRITKARSLEGFKSEAFKRRLTELAVKAGIPE